MAHYIDIIVRSLFIENLPLSFSGHVHLSRHLQKSESSHRPGGGGPGADGDHRPGQQPDSYLSAQSGALAWIGQPNLDLTFLGLLTYIGVIAAIVQILEMFLDRFMPGLYNTLGIFLPLLTVNCAILGGTCSWLSATIPSARALPTASGQAAVFSGGGPPGGHPRETRIRQSTGGIARARHDLHQRRPDRPCLHGAWGF
jgi:Na+-transporting NADH:ubiquinone oxidoreductase subunit E